MVVVRQFLRSSANFTVRLFCIATLVAFSGLPLEAAPPSSGITYSGKILNSDDQPVNSGNVTFNVWVQTPTYCSLYSEQHVVDMAGSSGTYSFEVGKGALQSFPHNGFGIKTLSDVFNNSKKAADFNPVLEAGCAAVTLAEDEARIADRRFKARIAST